MFSGSSFKCDNILEPVQRSAILVAESSQVGESTLGKRLRNIADNADRKAHNLYLNHTQATPNTEYVDYEDEETDCSSDISEVILNLNTYKPSTSNHLISLTDPKYKQLTPFVAKSSQMRLGLPSTAVVGDRFGVSDRAVAAIASSVLHDVGLTTNNNSDLMVDKNKLRREKAKIRFQALSEAQALPLKGLYFDGRKDSTLIEERVDTKRYTRKAKEERLCLIEELGSRYIIHLSPSFGTAKQISATIIGYFKGITRDLSQLLAIGCDGTYVNIGWKSGVIRCLELKLGKPLQWVICLLHFNEHLL
ncbi:hypothetical protein AVEN_19905-1 [Araneus ventricosus]|uniref:DUF4371 domain-containing protein n=1 Tax=Araneus ventricosus TaxID=182803 RepID=A0A4Y2F5J9_ARAVE|nr:hypothetical protein AVEN_2490-1 [Araneus ventricosus]GBM35423.1 hypothetical protein AVEN_19905-1 [Araneus ventricosus]